LNASGVEEGIDDACTIPDILAGYQLPEGVEDNTHRAMIEKTVKNFAEQAYRTILVCYRDMSMDQFNEMKESNNNFETDEDRDCLEQDLVGCCIWGLQDPLREGIEESIA
jgi:magnesium-transporting ATPase (P-type)